MLKNIRFLPVQNEHILSPAISDHLQVLYEESVDVKAFQKKGLA